MWLPEYVSLRERGISANAEYSPAHLTYGTTPPSMADIDGPDPRLGCQGREQPLSQSVGQEP